VVQAVWTSSPGDSPPSRRRADPAWADGGRGLAHYPLERRRSRRRL